MTGVQTCALPILPPEWLYGGSAVPARRQNIRPDGLIHGISDAGIVYSPRSTYIFTMFYWSEAQLAFDPTNILAADISGAVYQFFNAAE